MKRFLNIAAAVLLAAAVLVSCEPGPAGLFALLEEEEPLNKGTPALNANTAVFVTRVDGATDYYYAAVGATLLRRDVAGTTWETVSVPGAPAGSIISSGVSFGTDLYISYAPAADTIFHFDGTTWDATYDNLSTGDPVQTLLMASDGQMFAVTEYSTESTPGVKRNFYTIHVDAGSGDFTSTPASIVDEECGLPSSITLEGGNYWIAARNSVFRGAAASLVSDSTNVTNAGFSAANPVLGVWYDTVNSGVIAAATGKVWRLTAGGYTPSGDFGSSAQLSSVIVVPKNGGGDATIVGAKSWPPRTSTGYFEYNATQNSLANFGSSVVPSTAYDMVSDNSNYVTTLDDLSIEGFNYDATGYIDPETTHLNRVLFARTVGGGLWSNRYDTVTQLWSGWDRE